MLTEPCQDSLIAAASSVLLRVCHAAFLLLVSSRVICLLPNLSHIFFPYVPLVYRTLSPFTLPSRNLHTHHRLPNSFPASGLLLLTLDVLHCCGVLHVPSSPILSSSPVNSAVLHLLGCSARSGAALRPLPFARVPVCCPASLLLPGQPDLSPSLVHL